MKDISKLLQQAQEVPSGEAILQECLGVAEILLAKNAAYGDSALNPMRLFSKADAAEQLRVRLDDKVSRVSRGSAAGEDVVLDLMGYLVLLRIAEKRAQDGQIQHRDGERDHGSLRDRGPDGGGSSSSVEAHEASTDENLECAGAGGGSGGVGAPLSVGPELADYDCQRCDLKVPLKGKAICEDCLVATRGASNGKISEKTSEGVPSRHL